MKKKTLILTLLLAFILTTLTLSNFKNVATATPSVVGTSTTSYAICYSSQRKSFYANGRFWVFYSDGTNMVFRSSTDGSSWSSATTVRTCTRGYKFSLDHDGTYVHYVYAISEVAYGFYYRRGTTNSDGSISWTAEREAVTGDSAWLFNIPSIAISSSGYPWIGYRATEWGTDVYPFVVTSTKNDGGWSTASGFPYQLSTTMGGWIIAPVPLLGDKMYVLYAHMNNPGYGRLYTTTWGSQETAMSDVEAPYGFSAVAIGNDVHVVFNHDATNNIIYRYRNYYTYWASEQLVQATADAWCNPVLTIGEGTTNLFCFWMGKPTANHIYYKKRVVATWDASPTDWIDESTDGLISRDRLTGFYQKGAKGIGLVYMTNSVSPYDIKFAYLQPPTNDEVSLTNPSIGSQGCLAQKQAYTFRVKVTDGDGGTNIKSVQIYLNPGDSYYIQYKWIESTDTFIEALDPNGYCSISSTSDDSYLTGNQWTLDFKLTFSWAFPDENIHSLKVYTIDDDGFTDLDTFSNIYYVENDLIFSGLTVNDYRVNPGQTPLTFSGTIYYQGTSTTPNNGNYNVKIKLDGVQKGSTDTTLVSGQFSITGISAESSIASYSYTVECDYMASAGTFSAVVVDRLVITYDANSTNPDVGQIVQFTVTAIYDYDKGSAAFSYINSYRNTTHFAEGTPFTDQHESELMYEYTAESASDNVYGITAFTSNTLSVYWGGLFIEGYEIFVDDTRADIGSNIYFRYHLRFSGNQSDVGSGTLQVNDVDHSISSGWANFTVTSPTTARITGVVTAVSVNGETDYAQIPEDPQTIFDRIRIRVGGVSDARTDVGDTETVWFQAVYDWDFVSFDGGKGTLYVNETAMTWSSPNARWEKTYTNSTVVQHAYQISSVTDSVYGLTNLNDKAGAKTITWDRLEFLAVTVDDDRINAEGTFELRYSIRYDYDDVVFDASKGSVGGFSWDSGNSWWENTETGSSSITTTNYDETYITIYDTTYGLTVKQDVAGVNVITDGAEAHDFSLTYLGNGTYRYNATFLYAFDSQPIDNAVIKTLYPNEAEVGSTTTNSLGNTSIIISQENATQSGVYIIFMYSEPYYGLTYSHQNATFTLVQIEIIFQDFDGAVLYKNPEDFTVKYGITDVITNTTLFRTPPDNTYSISTVLFQGVDVTKTSTSTPPTDEQWNIPCYIYSLTVKVQLTTGEPVENTPLELYRDTTLLNGEYGLAEFPETNSTGYYMWNQLVNQTASYTIKSPWTGFSDTTTGLMENTLLTVTIGVAPPPPSPPPAPPSYPPPGVPTPEEIVETFQKIPLLIFVPIGIMIGIYAIVVVYRRRGKKG